MIKQKLPISAKVPPPLGFPPGGKNILDLAQPMDSSMEELSIDI
jgi:hypothetical protein